LYQLSTKGTNEDTTSSYSGHQQLQEKGPKQSPYTKGIGMNLNMIASQSNPTSELNDSTYMNLTERVSHQTMNKFLNPQMKNQLHLDPNQKIPAKKSSHSATHHQLKQQLHHQQHQEPPMLTTEENPESYHSQTHTTLASLLLAKNNSQPQQIWRLRLLQLQQQQLLSDQTCHQQPPPPLPLHRQPPQLHNELQQIYRLQCGEPLEALEDLEVLGTLEGLVDLEGPEDLADLLLLHPFQPPLQHQHQHQQETQTIDSWEAYPNPLKEIGSLHETSSTN
jgi:hypothetical protein